MSSKTKNMKRHIPFPTPRGLNDALGWTVLVESIKFSEAQKIPDRTLVSFFQVPSTLEKDKRLIFYDIYIILLVASLQTPETHTHSVTESWNHTQSSTPGGAGW